VGVGIGSEGASPPVPLLPLCYLVAKDRSHGDFDAGPDPDHLGLGRNILCGVRHNRRQAASRELHSEEGELGTSVPAGSPVSFT